MKRPGYLKLFFLFLTAIICLALIWVFTFPYNTKDSVVVRTTNGYVQGIQESGISVFKGIPYAAPPVGMLRFKSPQPCKSWKGILHANKFPEAAAQISDFTHKAIGNENSLFLNIYTPLYKGRKLPVLFWIHGGAMVTGSGSPYNGHSFADKDSIIVVTVNYRLGILGFTYLDDLGNAYKGSANNGMMDCIAALKWVKQNITAFGGDPERITIAGQSAGAKLACALIITPQAKGLFQQVISESGGLQSIRNLNTAKATRSVILKALHFKDSEAAKLLTIPTDTLLKVQKNIANGTTGLAFLGPVIDNDVLNEDPYQYISEGKTSVNAALIGNNKTEITSFFLSDKRLKKPTTAIFKNLFGDNAKYVIRYYRKLLQNQDSTSAAIVVLSQYLYIMHSFRLADALHNRSIPVYLYRFDYAKGIAGAGHGTELPFVWYDPLTDREPISEQLFEIARKLLKGANPLALQMHRCWVLFIKQGNPNHNSLAEWGAFTIKNKIDMLFNMPVPTSVKLNTFFNDPAFPSSGFILNSDNL